MSPEPRFFNIEYIFYKIYTFILSVLGFATEGELSTGNFSTYITIVWYVCLIFSILFMAGAIYFVRKTSKFREEEYEKYLGKAETGVVETGIEQKNKAWDEVVAHLNSDNSANWKLAIIEADKMLDEALSALGYIGASVGDKLKAVPPGFLTSVDDAWAAHKVRNQIAHETNFDLSEREARLVIGRYERVFRELELI